jgi:streptogramin lyase
MTSSTRSLLAVFVSLSLAACSSGGGSKKDAATDGSHDGSQADATTDTTSLDDAADATSAVDTADAADATSGEDAVDAKADAATTDALDAAPSETGLGGSDASTDGVAVTGSDAGTKLDSSANDGTPNFGSASDGSAADSSAATDGNVPAFQTKWFAQGVGDVEAITRGPDDTLWFITTAGRIGHMKSETDIPTYQIDPNVIGGTTGRNRIVKGPDGNLWFTIEKIRRFGYITPSGDITLFADFIGATPDDLTVGPDGNFWVAGGGEFAVRITPTGGITKFPCGAMATIVSTPEGLWYNDLWMGVARITTAGVVTQFPVLENKEESVTHGLATSNGQIWIIGSRYSNGMPTPDDLLKFAFTRRLSATGAFVGTPAVAYAYRSGSTASWGTSTAVAPDGSLWYNDAETVEGRVSPDGATLQRFPLPWPGTTNRFSRPMVDAAGAVWLPMRGGMVRLTLQ